MPYKDKKNQAAYYARWYRKNKGAYNAHRKLKWKAAREHYNAHKAEYNAARRAKYAARKAQ